MLESLVDIYSCENYPLGIVEYESIAHRDGLWHRSVLVCIYNQSREILLSVDNKGEFLLSEGELFWKRHFFRGESEKKVCIGEQQFFSLDNFLWAIVEVQEEMDLGLNCEFQYIYIVREDYIKKGNVKQLLQEGKFIPVKKVEKWIRKNRKLVGQKKVELWLNIVNSVNK